MTQEATLTLETDRLRMRPPHEADADAIATLANNWNVVQHLGVLPYPYARQDAVEFIARCADQRDRHAFAIVLNESEPRLIGVMGLNPAATDGTMVLGYWLGEPYWGHGYATEAAKATVSHAFERLSASTLDAACRPENPASRHVLEKCGFTPTGKGTMNSRPLGREVEIDRFILTRERWQTLTMAAHGGCTRDQSG